MKKIYTGWLCLGQNYEGDYDILFLLTNEQMVQHKLLNDKIKDGNYEILVNKLQDDLSNKFVSVKYFISDKNILLKQANYYFIRKLCGYLTAEYNVLYNETTGYLWTDENLYIGGHDLLSELKNYINKYLILIVNINDKGE